MLIKNTKVEATCPWPDSIQLIQGGGSGLVIRPASKGGNYGTAFVEVFSPEGGFIRGEGLTVSEAEVAAWEKYSKRAACPGHEYEARGYENGAGFCKHCNKFESGVFTPEELGCFCAVCGVPTFWSRIDKDFYCEVHADDPETRWLKRQRLKETEGTDEETVTGSQLGDFLERLSLEEEDEAREDSCTTFWCDYLHTQFDPAHLLSETGFHPRLRGGAAGPHRVALAARHPSVPG